MNNYLKILKYLEQFNVDGDYHDLTPIFEKIFEVSSIAQDDQIKKMSNDSQSSWYRDSNENWKIPFEKFERLIELLEQDGLIRSVKKQIALLTDNPKEAIEAPREIRRFGYFGQSTWSRLFKKLYIKFETESISAQITPQGLQYLKEMTDSISSKTNSSCSKKNHILSLSKNLIKEGSLKLAIESLFKLNLKTGHENLLYQILGKLSLLATDETKGTISYEQKNIAQNKAVDDLLSVIYQIEKYVHNA